MAPHAGNTPRRTTFFSSSTALDSLPVSRSEDHDQKQNGLRRRLSSISLRLHPISSSSSSSWSFRRSKSGSAIDEYAGSSLRKWWDWGWGWIMSRKLTFAKDLELNEEETAVLGSSSKGSLRHLFYKLRSEVRKLMGPGHLPTTQKFRYDAFSYAQNFDDSKLQSQG